MRGSPYPCHSALRQLLQTLPVAPCTSTSLRGCSQLHRCLDAAPVEDTIVCHKAAFATRRLMIEMCPDRATCLQCKPGDSQMGRNVNHNFLDAQQPSRATSAMRGSPYPCHSALRQLLQTLPVASCTSTSLRRCSELQRCLDAAPVEDTIVCHKAAFATQCLMIEMCPDRATCWQCKPGDSQVGRKVNHNFLDAQQPARATSAMRGSP